MDHKTFMQRAIALAREGKEKGGGPFGAVIVKDDLIIAEAHNEVNIQQDCTLHAELLCIQRACEALQSKDLSDCILYTSCVPCMMCLGAAKWARFREIYYGAGAQDAKEYGFIYSDMYYERNEALRDLEFNMYQLLREEAVMVWKE
ncbi:nucleoside deaminase [Croceiramulus getboli]|nr:nucleoside deaminase [Flavobacteriaceae bacterium YJPT1-3]